MFNYKIIDFCKSIRVPETIPEKPPELILALEYGMLHERYERNPDGTDRIDFDFVHQVFREYFAAKYLEMFMRNIENPERIDSKIFKWLDDNYRKARGEPVRKIELDILYSSIQSGPKIFQTSMFAKSKLAFTAMRLQNFKIIIIVLIYFMLFTSYVKFLLL